MEFFPKDIVWKIWNKVPMTLLKPKVFTITPEYLKFRALELFDINLEANIYLGMYEKYIQIASFNGEVTMSSKEHVPMDKIILHAVKDKYEDIILKIVASESEIMNVALLDIVGEDVKILENIVMTAILVYNPNVPDDVYIKLSKRLPISGFIEGLIFPVEHARKNHFRKNEVIIGAACSLDINRFLKIFSGYKGELNKFHLEKYILDEVPREQRFPELAILFGCPNILKRFLEENSFYESTRDEAYLDRVIVYAISKDREKAYKALKQLVEKYMDEIIVYSISKDRAKATYKALKQLVEKYPIDVKWYAGLEYWSWRVYGKSYVIGVEQKILLDMDFYKEFSKYKKLLNQAIQFSGSIKTVKEWCIQYEEFPKYINLVKESHLESIVIKIIDNFTQDFLTLTRLVENEYPDITQYLELFYTPKLYKAIFPFLNDTDQIQYCPSLEMLEKLPKSELSPMFLEPKLAHLHKLG